MIDRAVAAGPKILMEKAKEEAQRTKQFGNVKPMISTDFQDHKFVAVGNRLHYSKSWKTPADFFGDYVKMMFGTDWWTQQFKKPEADRSPVCRWCQDAYDYQKEHGQKVGNLYAILPSGPLLAYMTLGYDLYVLKHHQLLQEEILKRLKRTPEFHGARYELLVAATFIRAGFDIRYEDEKDNSSKHPEFVAVHKASGLEIDVEAKKRNRAVKLTPEGFNSGEEKMAIKDLLKSALGKFRDRPFVICLDLDVPPFVGNPWEQPWFAELRGSVDRAGGRGADGKDLFNMINFTNLPVEYTKEAPAAFRHVNMVSQIPLKPLPNEQILMAIGTAFSQFGRIPDKFD